MKPSKRYRNSLVQFCFLIGLIGLTHGVQQQQDSYSDAAAATVGVLNGGVADQHQHGGGGGGYSFTQDFSSGYQSPSDSYGAPSHHQHHHHQPSYSTGQDSGWGMPPEMKGWGMTEAPKGWGVPTTKGWGMPEVMKGWGMPKSKGKSKGKGGGKGKGKGSSKGGWGKPEMKGWEMPEMKGWEMPEMKGWGMVTEAPKGWGETEGPSYKYKYKVIPHESEEEEGWGWPEDEMEEKGKKKGLYGLFGLFGLMGILPWLFLLILPLLLFIPIPIIGNGRSLDLYSMARSKVLNSTLLADMDMDSMKNILQAISKDYSSVYKNTECLERWSCTLSQWAIKKYHFNDSSSLDKVSKLIGGNHGYANNNSFMKRVKQGLLVGTGKKKTCESFKCDLDPKKKMKSPSSSSSS